MHEVGEDSRTTVVDGYRAVNSRSDEEALVALARAVLDAMGIHPLAELSVLLVDVDTMERLHVQWMDEPGPKDVLSFPMDELLPDSFGPENLVESNLA